MLDLNNFYNGIYQASQRSSCPDLARLVQKERDLAPIYDFFLLGAKKQDLINLPKDEQKRIIKARRQYKFSFSSDKRKELKNMKAIVDEIRQLSPEKPALHLDRKRTGLKRALEIIRQQDGTLMLIVATNNKLAGYSPGNRLKQNLPRVAGGSKTGRAAAWQLVPEQKPLYKLVSYKTLEFPQLKKEALLSQKINSSFVNLVFAGQTYVNKGIQKLSLYSEYSLEGDLIHFLNKREANNLPLSPNEKNRLIYDILKGLQVLHGKHITHNDFKPENTLVFGNDADGYGCKVTDLGTATSQITLLNSGITIGYMPFEFMYYLYINHRQAYKNYLSQYIYANSLFFNEVTSADGCKKIKEMLGSSRQYGFSSKEMDIWAAGMTIFIILFGRPPTPADHDLIQNNDLLKAALDPNPKTRKKIGKLVEIHEDTMKAAAAVVAAVQVDPIQDEAVKDPVSIHLPQTPTPTPAPAANVEPLRMHLPANKCNYSHATPTPTKRAANEVGKVTIHRRVRKAQS